MKQLLLLLALFPTLLPAQEDYLPFAQDDKIWEIQIGIFKENVFGNCIDGDTLIGGETWKKVYNYFEVPMLNYSYYAAVRDVGKKVYAIAKGSNRPRLLYDFGMKVGNMVRCGVEGNTFCCLLEKDEQPDTLLGFKYTAYLRLERIDTIETCGLQLRRFNLSLLDVFKEQVIDDIVWVEGVGSCLSPFLPWTPLPSRDRFLFFKWCQLGKTYILDDEDFYKDIDTNVIRDNSYWNDENATIYDLLGRQQNTTPAKGVYIQDGKKYVK